jgi:hypothetical protein
MAEEQALTSGGFGITMVVLRDEKIAEIMDRSKDMLETHYRHTLELVRTGARLQSKDGDGCCNCVFC